MWFDLRGGETQSNRKKREKRDGGEIWNRGSHRENQALVNYQKLQTNRYAKTSFLQLREDAFESYGSGLRWFLPLQAVSLLSKVSTVAFSRLGCWAAKIAASLDTLISVPYLVKCVPEIVRREPARRLLLEPKERRESGENRREFEELLKRDW